MRARVFTRPSHRAKLVFPLDSSTDSADAPVHKPVDNVYSWCESREPAAPPSPYPAFVMQLSHCFSHVLATCLPINHTGGAEGSIVKQHRRVQHLAGHPYSPA